LIQTNKITKHKRNSSWATGIPQRDMEGATWHGKFNKFFMASAIKRAEDVWWDTDNHCIVTRAENKLDQILDQDQDLFFLDQAVEVDMENTGTQTKTKTQADLMSTGSILTFRLTVTATTQKTPKYNQCHMAKSKPHQILDQVSIMTRTMFLEKYVDALLKCLLLAMQAKNLISPPEMATSSQKTSGNK